MQEIPPPSRSPTKPLSPSVIAIGMGIATGFAIDFLFKTAVRVGLKTAQTTPGNRQLDAYRPASRYPSQRRPRSSSVFVRAPVSQVRPPFPPPPQTVVQAATRRA
jgi:hypothetical protein